MQITNEFTTEVNFVDGKYVYNAPQFELVDNTIQVVSYTLKYMDKMPDREQLLAVILNNIKTCLEKRPELKSLLKEVRETAKSEKDYRMSLYNIVINRINKSGYIQFLGSL